MSFITRFKNGWNAFMNKDPTDEFSGYSGGILGGSTRPDRIILNPYNGKSIMAPVINRIAIDVSNIELKHVKLDKDDRYDGVVKDSLNDILTFSANLDQTGRSFIQDLVMSMCDEGVAAAVPVDCRGNPFYSDSYKIETARVGKIVDWRPDSVLVNVYNERTGQKEDILYPKRIACIIENPFYQLMNAPNSTLQRLIRKLSLLDTLDERNSAGKLDLIIQLPYVIKTEQRRAQAESRKRDLENQLIDSRYGIAYTDGTERITQLNRPAENTLVSQIETLTTNFYNQLGMTQSIFDGTADESAMINYENRTISVIVDAIVTEMNRKWISPTAHSQGHAIMAIKDPFRHLTVNQVAEAADKFTRNEILSSNEVRVRIGYMPSDQPGADELRNKNLNRNKQGEMPNVTENIEEVVEENQNGND